MSEKLQKVLARAGVGSRREMETVISEGRVSVNGKIATLGDRVDASAAIRVDGHQITVPSVTDVICRVLAYHKPEGEVCTRHDPEGRPTVFDRLPRIKDSRWVAVGRLDVNTSGLLLFTTDGELANRLMHPSHEVEREYAVRVFGEVTEGMLQKLRHGVQLEDGPAKFDKITAGGGEGLNQWYNVTLCEGRNREVRRLWESLEVQVSRLMRIRYGDIKLDKTLPRGGWAELELPQVNYLRKMVGLPPEERSKVFGADDRRSEFKQAAQIRRAVRRHRERSILQGEEVVGETPTIPRTKAPRAAAPVKSQRDDDVSWENARQRLRDGEPRKARPNANNRQRITRAGKTGR
ncbi:23S rRNA pseudouridine(2605) synthase RluB [uncultured Tolumonas sp.]|uniref:23S rRNA pseudouridine(2605) synthase RluB n=1 Tax=uncultured Tolumonas sp. TaxID=263765 RepID=UPI0029306910|nr:23S rRNA pseudouridine(2605) synthase RluB [uncultured Tolumonas sp.]